METVGFFEGTVASFEDGKRGSLVTLLRGDISNAGVQVLGVIPVDERRHPLSSMGEILEALRISGGVLQGFEQRLAIGRSSETLGRENDGMTLRA